jgi:hypothetical protein
MPRLIREQVLSPGFWVGQRIERSVEMKKWAWTGIVVLILIVGLVVFALFNLGPIIKMAVNVEGPKIIKTQVHVDSVGVSLLSGKADLKGLRVGNPKGFSAPDAVKVGSIHVDVDSKSLAGNPVIIRKIEVIGPEITYERSKDTDNFRSILNNLKQANGSGKNEQKPSAPATRSGKKLLVRDVVIKDGKVSLYLLAGHPVTADLPAIHLSNIGGQHEGASPARVVQEIVAAVYKHIQSPAVIDSLNQQLSQLKIGVKGLDMKTLSKQLNQKSGGVVGKLKGLLGNQ